MYFDYYPTVGEHQQLPGEFLHLDRHLRTQYRGDTFHVAWYCEGPSPDTRPHEDDRCFPMGVFYRDGYLPDDDENWVALTFTPNGPPTFRDSLYEAWDALDAIITRFREMVRLNLIDFRW